MTQPPHLPPRPVEPRVYNRLGDPNTWLGIYFLGMFIFIPFLTIVFNLPGWLCIIILPVVFGIVPFWVTVHRSRSGHRAR